MIEFNHTEPAEYVAYFRVSTRKQGDSQLGLEAQRAYIDHFYQGKNIIDRFTDVRSGKDISGRPQLQAAMALCKLRKATLVVAKVDRLSRDTEQALWIYRELETRLESCDVPNLDKFTLTLFMAIADRERELGGIRTKAAMQVKVLRDGEWRVGSEAFYSGEASRLGTAEVRRIARLNTNSRQAMAQIRHLRSQGHDYASIARQLNADGFRAPRGGEYATVQVRRLWQRIAESEGSKQESGFHLK